MPSTIVDSHLHIWSEDRDTYPRKDTPYRASPELLLDYMDEAGVNRAVIVLPQFYRYDNRILADVMRQRPDRFSGVGVVDPRGEEAADALQRLWEEHGIRGVRLRANIEPEWFCTPETEPLWRRAGQLGLPLCVLSRPAQIRRVRAMVERFPETTVVVDHFSMIKASEGVGGATFQTFLGLAAFPKVHIKLSGLHYWGEGRYPWPQAQPMLRAAIERFTPARVMWGSDWPHILFGGGYIRNLNFVRRELPWLSDADRDMILGGTALRLWPAGGSAQSGAAVGVAGPESHS